MRGRGGGGNDYPSLLAKAQKDEQEGKGPKRTRNKKDAAFNFFTFFLFSTVLKESRLGI